MRFTTIEWVIAAIIVAILGMLAVSIPAQIREKEAFLAECSAREPMYRCQVQWKQMHPAPLVVIAPLNR